VIARRRLTALGCLAAIAALAGLLTAAARDDERGAGSAPAPDTPRSPPRPIEQDVGELLVMSFDGTTAPEFIHRRLLRREGTGVILFAKNAPDAGSLRALTRELQRSAGGRVLVATDQEGGAIRTLPFAEPRAGQPEAGSPGAAAAAARAGARDLRALGVNVVLAPVADVAGAPDSVVAARAYPGDVPGAVGAAVRSLRGSGVAATLKHFPGIGAATANTDDGPVTIEAARPELEERDLPPFRAGIDAGAPLVMASHALYPAFDRDRIASQSRALLVSLLRERLGFRGVVVTDSIEAQAVLARSGVAEAAERSVEAGADLVLMTGSGSWNLVQPRLVRRARRDAQFRARVREAAARVRRLKRTIGLPR
jgi:beta-N-acetylhexosaminidase